MATSALLLLVGVFPRPLRASDHLDGPATTAHRVTDLVDLYAFPTPKKLGFLTIILNSYPAIASNGHFSDKVDYTLRLRRASIRTGGPVGFDTSDEVAIRCTFYTPTDDDKHTASCRTDAGFGATVGTNRVGKESGAFQLYAGQRSDPFFFNAVFATAYADKGILLSPLNQNLLDGLNTLSVVIDVELKQLFRSEVPTLLAIAADSTTRDTADGPLRRLDRLGRPETGNITLFAHGGEEDLRDQYNADPSFVVPADHARAYRERIYKNLGFFDAIDHNTDWTDSDRAALAGILADDFLVVDVGLPCTSSSYLEIERSLLRHTKHQTCGGRQPSEDVMDNLFGLYTGGLSGPPIRDGSDHPSHPLLDTFPWLAEPDQSDPAKIKTFLLNTALQSQP